MRFWLVDLCPRVSPDDQRLGHLREYSELNIYIWSENARPKLREAKDGANWRPVRENLVVLLYFEIKNNIVILWIKNCSWDTIR